MKNLLLIISVLACFNVHAQNKTVRINKGELTFVYRFDSTSINNRMSDRKPIYKANLTILKNGIVLRDGLVSRYWEGKHDRLKTKRDKKRMFTPKGTIAQ